MQVKEVIWLPEIEDKLWEKHRITVVEAEEVLFGEPHVRFVEQGTNKMRTCTPLTDRPKQDDTSSCTMS